MKFKDVILLNEAIKPIEKGKGIIVFDIDDTILHANPKNIRIYKKLPDGKEVALTTDEYAKDPDAGIKKELFSYRDFRNPEKVYDSIFNGTPMIKNLKMLDAHLRAGYDFCFLTARGCEEVVKKAMKDFMMYRDKNGNLNKLGDMFKTELSHAVNDDAIKYPGDTDAEKKANVLKNLSNKYKKVVFVDDDIKNINAIRSLKIPNIEAVIAQK